MQCLAVCCCKNIPYSPTSLSPQCRSSISAFSLDVSLSLFFSCYRCLLAGFFVCECTQCLCKQFSCSKRWSWLSGFHRMRAIRKPMTTSHQNYWVEKWKQLNTYSASADGNCKGKFSMKCETMQTKWSHVKKLRRNNNNANRIDSLNGLWKQWRQKQLL